jgi:replicative DNA helicase
MSVVLFSNESERGVISGILHDPVERLDMVLEQLPEGGFYHAANETAFEVLREMHLRRIPLDPATLASFARDEGKLAEMGGEQAINDLYAHRPTTLHFRTYLQTLKEKKVMRQLNALCDRYKQAVYEPGNDPADLVDLFQAEALQISLERNEREPRHIGDVLEEIDADIVKAMAMADSGRKIAGFETGLARVDEILGGIEAGDRYVIAGLSNVGKTWRGLQMVRKLAEQDQRVLIFMLDGKDKEHIVRLYADVAGVELGFLLAGTYKLEDRRVRLERLAKAKAHLQRRGIFIDDTAHSIQEINAITRRMHKKHGITHTLNDYFGRNTSVGFKLSDKTAMLSSVAENWARGVDEFKGKMTGIMIAQANQNDFKVGQPLEQGPASLKDCKTLYDVATKGEGMSLERRDIDTLKKEELRIPDTDRAAAPLLQVGEQIILDSIIKSKNTRKGLVWARLRGDMGRMTDFDPNCKIGDVRSGSMARIIRQVEQGRPNYASSDYTGPRGRPRKEETNWAPTDD